MISPQQQYLSTQVLTATPGQLVIIVYDEAIKGLKMAKVALSRGQVPEVNRHLQKTQQAVDLLQSSLNYKAGDIAEKLGALYDFIRDHLVTANLKKDSRLVDEALSLLEGLREAWAEIVNRPRA
ncbi:MAG: flagellar export chaperone FliS [Firmicutes bacterium]|nr:flagellar export chaperone FliS [Bacillota bacterium]MCL5040447.1 flagellar export chaperone FliS [Bacillota bacterium]